MKVLVLFSGTKSIEKVFSTDECRGVDIDDHFKPYYNVDILKWDYQTELVKWVPDYIHSSPVCKEFSVIKYGYKSRDMDLGMSLLTKSLEIIEFIKTINPLIKITIENPVGLMRRQDCMRKYNRITTSYCMYGFMYRKNTDFWYDGFDLVLKPKCGNSKNEEDWCESKKKGKGYHHVRIGMSRDSKTRPLHGDNQIPCYEYFKQLNDQSDVKQKRIYYRYRIPQGLCQDIKECIKNEKYI